MELRISEAGNTKLTIRCFDCDTIELATLNRHIRLYMEPPIYRHIRKSVQENSDNRSYFETNIESCLDRLYGAALRLTKNASDAEDLVAETVTRGLKKIDTLKDCDRMIYWLLRIMSNHFISECRKAEKKTDHETYNEEPEDDAPFSLFERLHQPFLLWWGTPEQDFLNNTLSSDITKAIESLDTRYRIVVMLSDIEGMTYQEIADTIEVPVGTVRSRLARGRSHLQKALWQHGKDRDLTDEKKTTKGSSS